MKKIKLELTAEGAQVMHGAVQKRAADIDHASTAFNLTEAQRKERAQLQEAGRELADALTKHNLRPQDG